MVGDQERRGGRPGLRLEEVEIWIGGYYWLVVMEIWVVVGVDCGGGWGGK